MDLSACGFNKTMEKQKVSLYLFLQYTLAYLKGSNVIFIWFIYGLLAHLYSFEDVVVL